MADLQNNATTTEQNPETCPAVGYQKATVCVPVTVTPFAKPGDTTTICCGTPVIEEGVKVCEGDVNGSCTFTITQQLCVATPVDFGAMTKVGDVYVNCDGVSNEDICTNCGK